MGSVGLRLELVTFFHYHCNVVGRCNEGCIVSAWVIAFTNSHWNMCFWFRFCQKVITIFHLCFSFELKMKFYCWHHFHFQPKTSKLFVVGFWCTTLCCNYRCVWFVLLYWRYFWTTSWGYNEVWAGERSQSTSAWDSANVCRVSVCKWIANWWTFQVCFRHVDTAVVKKAVGIIEMLVYSVYCINPFFIHNTQLICTL